jgi:O-antigen ligase
VALLGLYPLWWALGLGVLIFPLLALPMLVMLVRRHRSGRRIRLPPGFAWWLVFLAALVAGLSTLDLSPAGAVDGGSAGRWLAVAFRLGQYASLTVILVFAGNLTEAELPRRRLVGLLSWLFVVTVAGGYLGMFAGHFAFDSPVELLLPDRVRANGFVQSLVHPSAAQVMDVLGAAGPRPAAPWGYTNTWGNNLCLLVVWFVVAWWPLARRRGARWACLAVLAVALAPIIYSLNRGLWIGLGVTAAYVALRLARQGRRWVLGVLMAGALALGGALTVTPLGDVVSARLENGHSNGVRKYLVQRAIEGFLESPVVGFGSTRDTQGGRNSIAVGESAGCERCGNFTIGGNGQLWQLLFAHGIVGTVGYLGFFLTVLWRYRRDGSAIGIAASAALVGSFAAMLWYNSLVTPLAFAFLAVALLWRGPATPTRGATGSRRPTPQRVRAGGC